MISNKYIQNENDINPNGFVHFLYQVTYNYILYIA